MIEIISVFFQPQLHIIKLLKKHQVGNVSERFWYRKQKYLYFVIHFPGNTLPPSWRAWRVSSKLVFFFHWDSRTRFFRLTYMMRTLFTNLNAFLKRGEVVNELWLNTTVSLLKTSTNHDTGKIIPNRTQMKNPSFELGLRILQVVLILWTRLTCSEYVIQTSRTIRCNRFPFWHVSYFPSQTAYL